MSGQTTLYKNCDEEMRRAIERVENYKGLEPLNYDMRAYAAYIEEHNIANTDIDESIWSMFCTDQ